MKSFMSTCLEYKFCSECLPRAVQFTRINTGYLAVRALRDKSAVLP